jgi:hypothetical protein
MASLHFSTPSPFGVKMAVEVHLVKLLLLLLVILLLALPLAAASVPLTWTRGVVESSFRQAHYGEVYHEPPVRSRVGVTPVRESIYIDTGEWLYHVSQIVTTRGMANLREGDEVEVAVKGKSLILRAGGKRYTTHIEQKSRAGQPVNSPASPR